jgi:hypothetical protein
MRVPLAILFSVCVIVGLGQIIQTNATMLEVPTTAFVSDTAPVADIGSNDELPTPVPPMTIPATEATFKNDCPQCPVYQPPVSPVNTDEASESEGRTRGRPMIGLVGSTVKVAARLTGHSRRAERRALRRGK